MITKQARVKSNSHKGFTLIELMIVVTIIAVIAAYAIPAFNNYVIRTRVAEALVLATPAKTIVIENMSNHRMAYEGYAPNDYTSGIDPTTNVERISVGVQGRITIKTTAKAGNVTLIIVPRDSQGNPLQPGYGNTSMADGRITWVCTLLTPAWKPQIVPTSCRHDFATEKPL